MEVHDACGRCQLKCTLKQDYALDTGEVVHRKGEFPISCKGIPKSYTKQLEDIVGGPEALTMFKKDEVELMLQGLDPVRWAKVNLLTHKGGWIPRGCTEENAKLHNLGPDAFDYQEVMLKCSARRKVFRMGRRTGKTEAICVRILHSMVTWPNGHCKILLVCPYKSQIEIIFKRLNELIADSPEIKNSIARKVSNPYHEMVMHNGSYIRGFSAGTQSGSNASSVRGQGGDIIIMDEMDYLNSGDIDSIAAILMDHPNTQLWASSTPTGRREKFYEWSLAPDYKEFHFPSMANPNWSMEMELEFKKTFTRAGYIHEVLADFGEEEMGVFRKGDIDIAIERGGGYDYGDQRPNPTWSYSIGVDWNPIVGTEIVVVGARKVTDEPGDILFRVVDVSTIEKQEFTEQAANLEIIRLNRKWNPMAIYLDYGGGGVNHEEQLRMFSSGHPSSTADGRLKEIVKVIDFGSSIEVYDPWTKQPKKKPMKASMVEAAVRKMEQHRVEMTSHDAILTKQMQAYIIKKLTVTGRPTYGLTNDAVGDHRLDAWMLAMFAFQMEATVFGKPTYEATLRFAGRFGEAISDEVLKSLSEAGVKTKSELKIQLSPSPRAVDAGQFGNPQLSFFGRNSSSSREVFASDRDHEAAWDAQIRKGQKRTGFGRSQQFARRGRGIPRRKTF